MAVQDLTGKVYGKLTVVSFERQDKYGVSQWRCRCECGKIKVVSSMGMKAGKSSSCGCHRSKILAEGRADLHIRQTIHGKSRTREHRIWSNMIYRCGTKTSPQYSGYGGRGIKVCKRWRDSFAAFLEDMGTAPSRNHTLDRFPDNNGNYEPKNCRWATRREQANNRSQSRFLKYKGETKTLCDWARQFDVDKNTLRGRLRSGWSVAKALETPSDKRYSSKGNARKR